MMVYVVKFSSLHMSFRRWSQASCIVCWYCLAFSLCWKTSTLSTYQAVRLLLSFCCCTWAWPCSPSLWIHGVHPVLTQHRLWLLVQGVRWQATSTSSWACGLTRLPPHYLWRCLPSLVHCWDELSCACWLAWQLYWLCVQSWRPSPSHWHAFYLAYPLMMYAWRGRTLVWSLLTASWFMEQWPFAVSSLCHCSSSVWTCREETIGLLL